MRFIIKTLYSDYIMSTETKTTHLSQLPNNNDNDTDLVNKILNELENISEEETNMDLDVIPSEDISDKNTVNTSSASLESVKTKSDSSEPIAATPKKINKIFESIDLNKVKKNFRMSTIIALLFCVFTLYTDTFVSLFSKFPLLSMTFSNELTTSGVIIQSILFGLLYFFINMFYFDN